MDSMTKWPLLSVLLAGALVSARPASAQSSAPSSATNEAARHFDAGLEAMLADRYDEGCPKLALAYHLDPRPGALFTLAECYSRWGRTESARQHYERYLRLVEGYTGSAKQRQSARIAIAQRQLQVARTSDDPTEPSATTLTLVYTAPPHEGPSGATPKRAVPQDSALPDSVPQDSVLPESLVANTPWRPWIYGLGGVGAASLLVGTATGIAAISEASTVETECTGLVCSSAGKAAADSAQTLGAASTTGFVIGVSSLAAAVTLFVFQPDEPANDQTAQTTWALSNCGRIGVCVAGAW